MSEPGSITVRVPLAIRRRPGRKMVVTPGGVAPTMRTHADPALLKALARAFRWQRLLDDGRYPSISELAAAERIDRGYLGTVLTWAASRASSSDVRQRSRTKPAAMRLTLLAPNMVEALMDGRQADDLSLPTLMDGVSEVWGTDASAQMQSLGQQRPVGSTEEDGHIRP